MSTLLRWIVAIALLAVGIVVKVLADSVPIDGALGFVWRMLTYAVILHVQEASTVLQRWA